MGIDFRFSQLLAQFMRTLFLKLRLQILSIASHRINSISVDSCNAFDQYLESCSYYPKH